jgi:hypothetical protein
MVYYLFLSCTVMISWQGLKEGFELRPESCLQTFFFLCFLVRVIWRGCDIAIEHFDCFIISVIKLKVHKLHMDHIVVEIDWFALFIFNVWRCSNGFWNYFHEPSWRVFTHKFSFFMGNQFSLICCFLELCHCCDLFNKFYNQQ